MNLDTIVCADAGDYLRSLPDGSVNCIVTSPPYYGLRDYGTVALTAKRLNRRYLGCDLNPAYVELARARVDSIPHVLWSLKAVNS